MCGKVFYILTQLIYGDNGLVSYYAVFFFIFMNFFLLSANFKHAGVNFFNLFFYL